VRQNARWKGPARAAEFVSSPEDVPLEQPQDPPLLRTDIQAILTVIGRRVLSVDRPEPEGLNLKNADLRRAYLNGAHLERAFLERAHLEGAYLGDDFLAGTARTGAHLEGAYLVGAHLERAYVSGAYLKGANLTGAYLEGADLRNVDGLTQEQVARAIDHGALLPPTWPQN
jgi:Pentapeptide repeats (8 copies)